MRNARYAAGIVALAMMLVAGMAFAQSGEIIRGRPSTPDQDSRRKADAPVDADTLGDDLAESSESVVPVVDEPGAPRALVRVAPRYPEAAAHAGIQGTVVVVAKLAADGSVAGARVVTSIPRLDRAATDAVHGWTFQPTLLKGKAIESEVAIPIRFLLPPDHAFDWRAARAAGAASERAGRIPEAFERYLAGFRAAAADSGSEAEAIRDDLLRVAARLPNADLAGNPRVVPVEARIALARGDSLLTATHAADAVVAYALAGRWAPWHAPIYRRLAQAEEQAGDRPAAAISLGRYLVADPRASDRGAVTAAIARLKGSEATPR